MVTMVVVVLWATSEAHLRSCADRSSVCAFVVSGGASRLALLPAKTAATVFDGGALGRSGLPVVPRRRRWAAVAAVSLRAAGPPLLRLPGDFAACGGVSAAGGTGGDDSGGEDRFSDTGGGCGPPVVCVGAVGAAVAAVCRHAAGGLWLLRLPGDFAVSGGGVSAAGRTGGGQQ